MYLVTKFCHLLKYFDGFRSTAMTHFILQNEEHLTNIESIVSLFENIVRHVTILYFRFPESTFGISRTNVDSGNCNHSWPFFHNLNVIKGEYEMLLEATSAGLSFDRI